MPQKCPFCSDEVLPTAAGECPSCRGLIVPTTRPQKGAAQESVAQTLDEDTKSFPDAWLDVTATERVHLKHPRSTPQIAGYRITGVLARGGMGQVWEAVDLELGREVAIKTLLPGTDSNRFVSEAKIAARLPHPGIPPVHRLGALSTGEPYLAMKLIRGKTLSELLRNRRLPSENLSRWLQVFEQICQAVGFAHTRGIIHRDIKPLNVMVGEFGEVQVMDWGLAKVLPTVRVADDGKAHGQQTGNIQSVQSKVGDDAPGTFDTFHLQTQMGSVMGTLAYMPPEQARGEIDNLDERADIFALGAILCEILTGQPPYVARDRNQILEMAARGELTQCFARLEASGADEELIALTRRCLELEPTQRPRNAAVLAEHVTGYLESVETRLREAQLQRAAESARADAEGKRAEAEAAQANAERQRAETESQRLVQQQQAARKLKKVVVGLAAVALVAVGASITAGNFWMEARSEAKRATEQEQKANLARDEAEIRAYTASLAAAAADLQRNDSLTVKRRLEEAPERLRGWEWSYLWNESDRSLETSLTLPPDNDGYHMDLSRDGKLVAVRTRRGGSEPVTVYDTRTGEQVAELKTYTSNSPYMTFSADSKLLAYHHLGIQGVQIFEIATGRGLVPEPHELSSFLGFDPAGERAVVLDDDGKVLIFKTSDWSQVTELPGTVGPGRRRGAVSPDGKLLVISAFRDDPMRIYDLTTNSLANEVSDSTGALALEFSDSGDSVTILSPEGDLVQYSATDWKRVAKTYEGQQNRVNLAVHRLDGALLRLTFDSSGAVALFGYDGLKRSATLRGHGSPGSSIAVDRERSEIVTAHIDGAVCRWDLRHPLDLPVDTRSVAFAPNGTAVYSGLVATGERPLQVCAVDPITGEPRGFLRRFPWSLVHESGATQLAFNPDGQRLAISTSSQWGQGLWRIYDAWTGVAEHDEDFSQLGDLDCIDWSADGRWLAVGGKAFENKVGLVRLYDASTYQEVAKVNGGAGGVHAVAFSHDGERLVVAADDGTLRTCEVPSGRLMSTVGNPGDSAVNCVIHSPDNRYLVAGSADGTVAVWEPLSGEQVFRSQVHGAAVNSMVFTPDGSRLMTASSDRSLKVFDPAAWRELLTLHLDVPARAMSFCSDSQRLTLATGSLIFLESAPEVERTKLRRLVREQKETAETLVRTVLENITDPLQARAQVLDKTASNENLRTAAINQLAESLDDRWNVAYQIEQLEEILNLQILHEQLVLHANQNPSAAQTRQLIAGINASKELDAIQRQAILEYTTAKFNLYRFVAADKSQLDTQELAWQIVSNRRRSSADYLLACFGMEPVFRQQPQNADCLITMAWAEYRVGWYADALEFAERGIELIQDSDGSLAPFLAVIAMCQHQMGETEAGVETLQKLDEVLKRSPGNSDQNADSLADEARKVLASAVETSWNEQAATNAFIALSQSVLGKSKSAIWLSSVAERQSNRYVEQGDLEAAAAASKTVQDLLEAQLALGISQDMKDSEVADLNLALAKVHALQGHSKDALASLSKAVSLVTDRTGKANIIAEAAALDSLQQLAERQVDDGPFQAELARYFGQRDQHLLATAAGNRARILFEAKLAQEPENSALASELADVILSDSEEVWTILRPTNMTSAGGATLSLKDDGSILVSGVYSKNEVYHVQADVPPGGITAIRLEALPDPSLPNNGPGRAGNGNFYLNELRVLSVGHPLPLTSISTTYDEFSEAPLVIDGKVDSAAGWAIIPKSGQPHIAIIATQLQQDVNSELKFELHFAINRVTDHTLGRFRLSVSRDPAAFERARRQLVAMKSKDPWVKLAAAYDFLGDQSALSQLLEQRPTVAAGLADLLAAEQD